ncbi:MAG TPA: hypothetical protein VFQ53_14255 [Kofleriaceae bacterium]|nr:hypothetical protein [Kofleriaceae bacterium]
MAVVITGSAYGKRATLEVDGSDGDRLTWRAVRGFAAVHENIVTTIHAVREAGYFELRHTWAGFAIAALGTLWLVSEGAVVGLSTIAAGIGWIGWRFTHPRRFLALDLGQSQLVMKIDPGSAAAARALADRIDRAIASGEEPATPPMLP